MNQETRKKVIDVLTNARKCADYRMTRENTLELMMTELSKIIDLDNAQEVAELNQILQRFNSMMEAKLNEDADQIYETILSNPEVQNKLRAMERRAADTPWDEDAFWTGTCAFLVMREVNVRKAQREKESGSST